MPPEFEFADVIDLPDVAVANVRDLIERRDSREGNLSRKESVEKGDDSDKLYNEQDGRITRHPRHLCVFEL